MILIRRLPSASPANTKDKMRRWRSQRRAPPGSILTIRRLYADLHQLTGPRVFKDGMIGLSSMARIIQPQLAFLSKPGARFLATSAPRLFSQFLATKICVESAKRSRRSLVLFCCRKSEASERLRQMSWQKFYPPTLHHSPTPLLRLLVKRSIK